MASLLKKERVSDGVRQAISDRDDPQASFLVDETDIFDASKTNLSLQISGNNLQRGGKIDM